MSIEPVEHLRRTTRVVGDPAQTEVRLVDILPLPLAGLALSLLLLSLPGTSDAIAAACVVAAML